MIELASCDPGKPYAIYCTRFNALIDEIDAFAEIVNSGGNVERLATIKELASRLKTFADKQYRFFVAGFYEKDGLDLTEKKEPTSFTKEYVFGHLMRQISADLIIIRRAYHSRKYGSPAERDVLKTADALAVKALEPAMKDDEGENGLISKNTTALTYFQKSSMVRVIPYASVAIIGIPLTCVDQENNLRDLLAIPHEVGHYIYWHGRLSDSEEYLKGQHINSATYKKTQALIKEHKDNKNPAPSPGYLVGWQEDIFADVYGCLVAGPVIARKMQELIFDNYTITGSDRKHPIAAARPLIYTHSLRRFGLTSIADELQTDWENRLSERGIKKLDDKLPDRDESVSQIRGYLDTVVNNLLAMFKDQSVLVDDSFTPKMDMWSSSKNYNEIEGETPGSINSALIPSMPLAMTELDSGWVAPDFYFDSLYNQWKQILPGASLDVSYETKESDPPGWSRMISRSGWTIGGPDKDGSDPPL